MTTSTELSFAFSRRTSRHGHWVCWMCMGGKSSLIKNIRQSHLITFRTKICRYTRVYITSRRRPVTGSSVSGTLYLENIQITSSCCSFNIATHSKKTESEEKRTQPIILRTAIIQIIPKPQSLPNETQRKANEMPVTWYQRTGNESHNTNNAAKTKPKKEENGTKAVKNKAEVESRRRFLPVKRGDKYKNNAQRRTKKILEKTLKKSLSDCEARARVLNVTVCRPDL